MRPILQLCVVTAASSLSLNAIAIHARPAESLPNIILMMADDMGMGDTSAYQDLTGNSDQDQLHTPAMEQLARMGVRFTDAHTPSSRCSPTRYGLLTGRYPWRNRLKHWVLFGAQGDPMIERDRPTIATMLRDCGYRTGMVGKWHVGLRYRRSDGRPAAGWNDADLTKPLFDGPLDHGFDFCRFTSRSHGTSGPEPGKRNKPDQTVGPGHIDGRTIIGATDEGRKLAGTGSNAYVLSELGGRHFANARQFISEQGRDNQPFFLYYASNSNHGPHTPDIDVNGQPVSGAGRNVAGQPVDKRGDYIYENDVVLGELLNYLRDTDDSRRSGHKLIENTLVIFTSDNGAERDRTTATGPFRSHKGSTYEGGHRVPFIMSWPLGKIGDGDSDTVGPSIPSVIGLQDVYATFAQIVGSHLPDPRAGEKGAEDSESFLAACYGTAVSRTPKFFNDHKQAEDPAACAMRFDNPVIGDRKVSGQWKILFDARLLRRGTANATELYNLKIDREEQNNLIDHADHSALVNYLSRQAEKHRNAGGHRLVDAPASQRIRFDWQNSDDAVRGTGDIAIGLAEKFVGQCAARMSVSTPHVTMTMAGVKDDQPLETCNFDV